MEIPSDRISVTFDNQSQTSTIVIHNLNFCGKLLLKEFLWFLFFGLLLGGYIAVFTIIRIDRINFTTNLVILSVLGVFTLFTFINFIGLAFYYLFIPKVYRKAIIKVNLNNNEIQMSGYGFARKYNCCCLFQRIVPTYQMVLYNSFIQYNYDKKHCCCCCCFPCCASEKLETYLRGFNPYLLFGNNNNNNENTENGSNNISNNSNNNNSNNLNVESTVGTSSEYSETIDSKHSKGSKKHIKHFSPHNHSVNSNNDLNVDDGDLEAHFEFLTDYRQLQEEQSKIMSHNNSFTAEIIGFGKQYTDNNNDKSEIASLTKGNEQNYYIGRDYNVVCKQKWNQTTIDIFKNILNTKERKWLTLYLIKYSNCPVITINKKGHAIHNQQKRANQQSLDTFYLQISTDDSQRGKMDGFL